jgi:formate/nitrite transporter
VIGKLVAAAVALEPDMSLSSVSDVVTDWRAQIVIRNGFRLFGATPEHANTMRDASLDVAGMAALFARMGRTVVPLFLAVSLFVAAGFQHSPANMAYFSLAAGAGIRPGWAAALGWSIIPEACGNVLGGFLLVVVPFWVVFGSKHSAMVQRGDFGEGS